MADDGPTIATAYVQLVPTLQGVQGKIGEAFAPVQQEAEQAGKETGNSFAASMWDGIKTFAGPAAIGGALAGLYQIGSTFDDVADDIRVTTGKSGQDLDDLIAMTKRVGTEVPANFDKISPVIGQLSQRMGLTGSDLENVAKQFVAAGNVLGQDVDIDSATAAFNAFGVAGSDVQTAMDNLYKVSQTTGTGFNELTSAAKSQAPALKQLGFSFDDTIGLIGQMDKAGLNSSAVLGSMGKSLVKLAKDGEEPKAAFERVSGEIGTLVASGNDAAAIDLASGIFGTKGAVQFVEATKNGTLNLEGFNQKIAENGDTILGAQEDTADFAESWTIFKNKALVAIEPVATAVFGFAGEAMGALTDSFEGIVDVVKSAFEWFDKYKGVAIALGVVIVGLTANIILNTAATVASNIATKAVTIATNAWAVAQKVLNLVLKDNPIGLVVAAIAALVAAAIWAYQNVDWFRDAVDNAWSVISNAAQWAWENVIKPVFEALTTAVIAVWDFFANFGTNLETILNNIGTWIANSWNNIITFFTELPGVVWGLISAAAGQLVAWGGQFLSWLWDGIKTVAVSVWDWFLNLPSNLWNFIVGAWSVASSWGTQFVQWIWNGITNLWESVKQWFYDLPSNLWSFVSGIWSTVITWGSQLIEWIWHGTDGNGGIVGKFNEVINWFKGIPGMIGTALNNVMNDIIGIGSKVVEWIANGVTNGVKAVTDAIEGLFKDITVEPDGTLSHPDGYVTANPFAPAAALGMVIPGYAPGIDSVPIMASPGEGILVPEAVRMLGADWVYGMNAFARGPRGRNAGRGYATGGILGDAFRIGEGKANSWGKSISDGNADDWLKTLAKNAANSIVTQAGKLGLLGGSGAVIMNGNITVDGYTAGLPEGPRGEAMKAVASKMGTEYVWGAAGPNVFDCSGLMSWALTQAGIGKGRLTAQGFNASFPHVQGNGKPGDMPTFDTGRLPGQAGHIGMVLDPGRGLMMHTDGAGPARVGDYLRRDGGPLSIVDAIGGNVSMTSNSGKEGDPPSWLGSLVGKFTSRLGLGGAGGAESQIPDAGGGVERWRPIVMQALSMLGQAPGFANYVLHQMDTESSGNPNAINLWDSNAKRGTPSKGLMQVIDPTFRSYAMPGYDSNIYDPLSNILASIRYVLGRYGSIPAGMRGVAYDSGGWLFPWQQAAPVNMLNKPEPVLTPRQWDIAEDAIAHAVTSRGSGRIQMTVYQQPGQSAGDLARELDRRLAFSGGRPA
jgi:TP901 family phage tail tape measure protein